MRSNKFSSNNKECLYLGLNSGFFNPVQKLHLMLNSKELYNNLDKNKLILELIEYYNKLSNKKIKNKGGLEYDIETINKPWFSPPAILFPIVWTILYILMGISAYIISRSKSDLQIGRTAYLINKNGRTPLHGFCRSLFHLMILFLPQSGLCVWPAGVLHGFHDAVAVFLQRLFPGKRILNGNLHDAAFLGGDDAAAMFICQRRYGMIAHAGRGFAVTGGR